MNEIDKKRRSNESSRLWRRNENVKLKNGDAKAINRRTRRRENNRRNLQIKRQKEKKRYQELLYLENINQIDDNQKDELKQIRKQHMKQREQSRKSKNKKKTLNYQQQP